MTVRPTFAIRSGTVHCLAYSTARSEKNLSLQSASSITIEPSCFPEGSKTWKPAKPSAYSSTRKSRVPFGGPKMAAKWDLAALSVDRHWSSTGLFDWHAGRGPNATAVSKHAVLIRVRIHLTVASYDDSECPQSGRGLKFGFL